MGYQLKLWPGCQHLELLDRPQWNDWLFTRVIAQGRCLQCQQDTYQDQVELWSMRYTHTKSIFNTLGCAPIRLGQPRLYFVEYPDDLFLTQALVSKMLLLIYIRTLAEPTLNSGWWQFRSVLRAETRPELFHAVGWCGYASFLKLQLAFFAERLCDLRDLSVVTARHQIVMDAAQVWIDTLMQPAPAPTTLFHDSTALVALTRDFCGAH